MDASLDATALSGGSRGMRDSSVLPGAHGPAAGFTGLSSLWLAACCTAYLIDFISFLSISLVGHVLFNLGEGVAPYSER